MNLRPCRHQRSVLCSECIRPLQNMCQEQEETCQREMIMLKHVLHTLHVPDPLRQSILNHVQATFTKLIGSVQQNTVSETVVFLTQMILGTISSLQESETVSCDLRTNIMGHLEFMLAAITGMNRDLLHKLQIKDSGPLSRYLGQISARLPLESFGTWQAPHMWHWIRQNWLGVRATVSTRTHSPYRPQQHSPVHADTQTGAVVSDKDPQRPSKVNCSIQQPAIISRTSAVIPAPDGRDEIAALILHQMSKTYRCKRTVPESSVSPELPICKTRKVIIRDDDDEE